MFCRWDNKSGPVKTGPTGVVDTPVINMAVTFKIIMMPVTLT